MAEQEGRLVYVVNLVGWERGCCAPGIAHLLRQTDKTYWFAETHAPVVNEKYHSIYLGPRTSAMNVEAYAKLSDAWGRVLGTRMAKVKRLERELAEAKSFSHDALKALTAAQQAEKGE